MQIARLTLLALVAAGVAGCGDNGNNKATPDGGGGGNDSGTDSAKFPVNSCANLGAATCMQITDATALQTAANSIAANTTLVLGLGTFKMIDAVTIRTAGTHIIGQGIDQTVLDFSGEVVQSNGVDVIGNDFLIQDLTVLDSPKDGIRVESSIGVVYRRIRATWSTESSTSNGAYGIYPVKSQNVLVEDSRAENASDAGLYVGQCQHVIVRNNTVTGNVAGLEIENTQYAEVYGNTATNNTGGIVVFDLPGNPIIGRDVWLHDNMIHDNNHVNFGAIGTTVSEIPVGTGTFAMASRRVQITNNTYANNNTGDIALLSGRVIEGDPSQWTHTITSLTGDLSGLNLLPGVDPDTGLAIPGTVTNFRSENIVVSGNHHSGSGTNPDLANTLGIGALFAAFYGPPLNQPVDNVLYDTVDETGFDSTDPANNTNLNNMCIGGNTGGTFASFDSPEQDPVHGILKPFFRPDPPFTPFNCLSIDPAVQAVILP